MCCSVIQCVATWRISQQSGRFCCELCHRSLSRALLVTGLFYHRALQKSAEIILQCVAVCCSVLQCEGSLDRGAGNVVTYVTRGVSLWRMSPVTLWSLLWRLFSQRRPERDLWHCDVCHMSQKPVMTCNISPKSSTEIRLLYNWNLTMYGTYIFYSRMYTYISIEVYAYIHTHIELYRCIYIEREGEREIYVCIHVCI